MPNMQIAVQLYTLRDLTAKDFAGTMKRVAEIGYKNVELAGYGNLPDAKAARKALDDAGLKAVSGHYAIDMLSTKVEQVMADAEALDMKLVVCPFLPPERRKDAAAYEATAKVLNDAGNHLHQRGMELAYHNHAFEFEKLNDGRTGFDILFDKTEHHLVKVELDVYWVQYAGVDPVAPMNNHENRVRMLHLKDMGEGAEKRFAPVGAGVMDFKPILAAAEQHGVLFGAVEPDKTYDTPPLDAIRLSFENLKKMGAV